MKSTLHNPKVMYLDRGDVLIYSLYRENQQVLTFQELSESSIFDWLV